MLASVLFSCADSTAACLTTTCGGVQCIFFFWSANLPLMPLPLLLPLLLLLLLAGSVSSGFQAQLPFPSGSPPPSVPGERWRPAAAAAAEIWTHHVMICEEPHHVKICGPGAGSMLIAGCVRLSAAEVKCGFLCMTSYNVGFCV
jgi:hypothetical protein